MLASQRRSVILDLVEETGAVKVSELVERLVVVDVSPTAYSSGREFVGYIETMRALDLSALERRDQADEALR